MAKVRLTSNQKEVLHAAVTGRIGGRMFTSVPALVKRGLLRAVEVQQSPPPFRGNLGMVRPTGGRVVVYRLTPEGHEAYKQFRTARYEAAKANLDEEYERDLQRAFAQAVRTARYREEP